MDETFSTMHSRGSPLSLNPWYTDGTPSFTHISFFNGTEELCLVEASGRVRVLSIPSRSFRSVGLESRSAAQANFGELPQAGSYSTTSKATLFQVFD